MENTDGLSSAQAKSLLAEHGPNEIATRTESTLLSVFLSQFKNPLVFVLLIVGAITWYLQEYTDTIVILTVVMINSFIGTFQEIKVKNTLNSLKQLLSPHARVYRDGQLIDILARELVPGDLLSTEAGDRVPADAELLQAANLQINESQFTGESYPKSKNVSEDKSIFMGTIITSGRGLAIVTETGLKTELGKISASVVEHINEVTPLEKKFKALSRQIVVAIALVCVAVFFLGVARDFELQEMFKIGVSLGVSAIPEGLPIVVTVTLAIGVYRMSQKRAVIRNLPSVSTLAGVDVICTDKTGTITEGKVELSQTWQFKQGKLVDAVDASSLELAVLCNDAEVGASKIGDLLDIAILEFAQKHKLNVEAVRQSNPRIDEIPFDSDYKYQATLHQQKSHNLLIVKGAFETLLPKCTKTKAEHLKTIATETNQLARQGFKVLLVASKELKAEEIDKNDINDLHFDSLLVFFDPLRGDVKQAVQACHDAGVNVIMVTGDHLETAKTIAMQAGIYNKGELAVDSQDFKKELAELAGEVMLKVIARAKPLDKSELIGFLKGNQHVVAMTGDGVNDAPALVQADIGIAMGKIGTDAAREASDMVLLDDKFSTIVNGIFEARGVFENIRKVISYLFTTSFGEIVVILLSLVLMMPLPLTAVLILWLNVITDGLLDISIATENNTPEIMKKSHERYRGPVIDKLLIFRILLLGGIMGLGSLWMFNQVLDEKGLEYARTACLVVLAMYQWFHAFNSRSEDLSIFQIGIFKNRALLAALALIIGLTILAIYAPFMQGFLGTVAVGPEVWLTALVLTFPIIIIEELRKWIFRRWHAVHQSK